MSEEMKDNDIEAMEEEARAGNGDAPEKTDPDACETGAPVNGESADKESAGAEKKAGADDRSSEKSGSDNSGKSDAKTESAGAGSSGKKDPRDTKIEELQDRLRRQMAEFDNFRKRTEKEKSAMYEIGARDIIEKILPVLDNFERGLAAIPEDEKESSFTEGMTMIYKQFVKTLEDMGVETIETKGQKFDPNLHNAVMHIDDEAYGENEISQELQKGYKYRGTVVRHSMVQVAN